MNYPDHHLYNSQKLETIKQLAGGISHDFNNRIGAIVGFANLIRMKSADDKIKKMAEEILMACKNSGDLVKELLSFARDRQADAVRVSVHDVVNAVVKLLSEALDKKIEVKSELKAERHFVMINKNQLLGALLNLALNSRDATPEEGGAIIFSTECADVDKCESLGINPASSPNGVIRISVADFGSGFGAEVAERLFEPFFTTREGHEGLGLAAAQRAVKQMGGAIEVTGAEGQGAVAAVTLPLC